MGRGLRLGSGLGLGLGLGNPNPYLMESQLVPAPIAKVRLMTDARRAGLAGRADSNRDSLGW